MIHDYIVKNTKDSNIDNSKLGIVMLRMKMIMITEIPTGFDIENEYC